MSIRGEVMTVWEALSARFDATRSHRFRHDEWAETLGVPWAKVLLQFSRQRGASLSLAYDPDVFFDAFLTEDAASKAKDEFCLRVLTSLLQHDPDCARKNGVSGKERELSRNLVRCLREEEHIIDCTVKYLAEIEDAEELTSLEEVIEDRRVNTRIGQAFKDCYYVSTFAFRFHLVSGGDVHLSYPDQWKIMIDIAEKHQ